VFATVTIQTHNHAETLATTLESLWELRCPQHVDYEILVVDNDSSDHTPEVIRRYAKVLAPRLRSVFEPKQGLSHARNRALCEARGEIVCFLDDDVKVDPGWLEAVSNAFINLSAVVVGGRSYLIYPTVRPFWLPPERETLLSRLDHGAQTLVNTDKTLFGLNFSVRRKVALNIGGFKEDFGRRGKSLLGGEEEDLLFRIRKVGGVVVYEPKAVVGHMVAPERLSRSWFYRRCYADGVISKRLDVAQGKGVQMRKSLEYAIRCCGSLCRTFLFKYGSPQDFFDKQIYAIRSLGILIESTKWAWEKNQHE